jgi:DNA-binding transcriptional ArsR family regulator
MNQDGIRQRSKELLGNMYRLEVAEAIAHAAGDAVTTLSVHEETGIRYARVQEELRRLKGAGILKAQPSPPGQPVEYKAEPTSYWELCKRLLDELRQ